MEITLPLLIGVAIIALLVEYIDASLGMGYGTTFTPLLLIMGFAPLAVVPAVLLGQLAGGAVAGYFHHRVGNINLTFRHQSKPAEERDYKSGGLPWSRDVRVIAVLALSGIVGAIVGVTLAVNIPEFVLRLYIGLIVLVMGIIILMRRNHNGSFSWRRLIGIGLLSAFNKGISGGGYGPLATGGQILSGREVKSSIGSTTVAEMLVCVVSLSAYAFLLKGSVHWPLAISSAIGSAMAGLFAARTVKKVEVKKLKLAVGAMITILGAITVAKVLL